MNKSISENLSELIGYYKQYLQLRLKEFKISMGEKLIDTLSSITFGLIFWLIILIVMLFAGFAFAYWFGKSYDNYPLGFLITAGIYLLFGVVFYLLRKPLIFDPLARRLGDVLEIENREDEKEKD